MSNNSSFKERNGTFFAGTGTGSPAAAQRGDTAGGSGGPSPPKKQKEGQDIFKYDGDISKLLSE